MEDITASQKALLKDMTIKAYAKYGITFESDIYHLTNNDYPVMKDIYDLIMLVQEKVYDKFWVKLKCEVQLNIMITFS